MAGRAEVAVLLAGVALMASTVLPVPVFDPCRTCENTVYHG